MDKSMEVEMELTLRPLRAYVSSPHRKKLNQTPNFQVENVGN